MAAIVLDNVSKDFTFTSHRGLLGFLKPTKKLVSAVNGISFTVQPGEAVAFIGPNGAGKSTTIKMLSGIMRPSSGTVRVLEYDPLRQRRELAMHIGTVFGQRSQLVFNLPLTDSFLLSVEMYRIPRLQGAQRIKQLIEWFDLGAFADQPVRKLSLGQRMRAEVANALIHSPQIIFLDEPTIGLDIVAKRALREVIKAINRQGTTVFLTSHDVGDIEEVCGRTIIVNHGQIVLDAQTATLRKNYLQHKRVAVVPHGKLLSRYSVGGVNGQLQEGSVVFSVDTARTPLKKFLPQLLETITIADLTIEDTPLEDIIHELYTSERQ